MVSRKDDHIDIRLQTGELEKIRLAAARDYLTPTAWVRRLILKAIDRTVPLLARRADQNGQEAHERTEN